MNTRTSFHFVIRCFVNLIIAIIAGFALLSLVYMLPADRIKFNVLHSADMYKFEQVSQALEGPDYDFSALDNYTDGLMLLTAMDDNDVPFLDKVLLNYRTEYRGEAPNGTIVLASQNAEGETIELSYPRYWHGYLIWMKPLLMFFDASDLRVINMFLQFVLVFWLLCLIQKRIGAKYSFAFLVTWLILNPLAEACSFQYSAVFYIMLIASVIALRHGDYIENKGMWPIFFLNIGIAIGYFDLLTYPVASFGIPLIICVLMYPDKWETIGRSIKKIIGYGISWLIGYAGMWAGKWIITQAFTDFDAIKDALVEVLFRTSDDTAVEGEVTAIRAIMSNVSIMLKWPFVFLFVGILVLVIVGVMRGKWHLQLNTVRSFVLVIIAILPLCWYCALQQHSILHCRYTYRDLSVSVLAVFALLFGSCHRERSKVK